MPTDDAADHAPRHKIGAIAMAAQVPLVVAAKNPCVVPARAA
jgi:hypothetical protein